MARVDPYKNFRFLVELDGIVQAGFTDCSGFGSEMEVVEYREGGDPDHVHKLRAKAVYPNITLKWGVTDSHELYDWHLGGTKRRSSTQARLDHPPRRHWTGEGAMELLRCLAKQVGGIRSHRQRQRCCH